MNGATRQPLSGGRWLYEHGPIHCVIGADGTASAVDAALDAAWVRFQTVLTELVAELPMLRADLSAAEGQPATPRGRVAQRMVNACRPHAEQGRFITAMAAVAGSVAQELIAAFERPDVRRAYVNNGGDIALHLAPGESYDVGVIVDPTRVQGLDGHLRIHAASGVRGVATSGWRGRSFSLGIADSVTVLAADAAQADAAATLIANAVNLDDPFIQRLPANQLRDDTDLGARLVTVAVPTLAPHRAALALAGGATLARALLVTGQIHAAVLCLQGQLRRVGDPGRDAPILRPARPVTNRPPAWIAAPLRLPRPVFTGA